MLKAENEVIEKMLNSNEEFKDLFTRHIELEQDLEALYSLKYFPPEVETKIKEIKKTKLRGKDKMEVLVAEYKSQNNL
jgi:uncharacterized protein YdcH (DUF465 family)